MHLRFARGAAVMQDSLLRSLLKGVVWRVFSTALTVSIILAVFRDTVQVSTNFAGLLGSAEPQLAGCFCTAINKGPLFVGLHRTCSPLLCIHLLDVLLVLQVLHDDTTSHRGPASRP